LAIWLSGKKQVTAAPPKPAVKNASSLPSPEEVTFTQTEEEEFYFMEEYPRLGEGVNILAC